MVNNMVYYLLKDSIPRFQGKENFQIKRNSVKGSPEFAYSCASGAIPAKRPKGLATRAKKKKIKRQAKQTDERKIEEFREHSHRDGTGRCFVRLGRDSVRRLYTPVSTRILGLAP